MTGLAEVYAWSSSAERAPGTGTLRPPDNTHRTLSPEAAAALAQLDHQDHP